MQSVVVGSIRDEKAATINLRLHGWMQVIRLKPSRASPHISILSYCKS